MTLTLTPTHPHPPSWVTMFNLCINSLLKKNFVTNNVKTIIKKYPKTEDAITHLTTEQCAYLSKIIRWVEVLITLAVPLNCPWQVTLCQRQSHGMTAAWPRCLLCYVQFDNSLPKTVTRYDGAFELSLAGHIYIRSRVCGGILHGPPNIRSQLEWNKLSPVFLQNIRYLKDDSMIKYTWLGLNLESTE